MCGFNKMGPSITLPELQWLLFEPCSLIASFHDVVMFPGFLGHPTFQCAIFFFFGLPQVTCRRRKATNIRRTEGRPRKQIGMINQELLETVEANFWERLQICILQNGHHLSDIIFRT